MKEKRTLLLIALLIAFALAAGIAIATASYNDYSDYREDRWGEEEDSENDDAVGYYDYAGQWHEIPEPDPHYPAYERHHAYSPISMMMPFFILFFVLFWFWLVYALVRGDE